MEIHLPEEIIVLDGGGLILRTGSTVVLAGEDKVVNAGSRNAN